MATPFFKTEKEIEQEYLISEARQLPAPGGGTQYLRFFGITWKGYDFLRALGWTPQELVDMAEENRHIQNVPFEESFRRVIATGVRITKIKMGIDPDYGSGEAA